MRKSRFTEVQIIGMIKEQEAGLPATEFTSTAILKWAGDTGVAWHYIEPGQSSGKQSPGLFSDPPHTQQNGLIESFNGSLRPSHACTCVAGQRTSA